MAIFRTAEHTLHYFPGGGPEVKLKFAPHAEKVLRIGDRGEERFIATVTRQGDAWPYLIVEAQCSHLELMEPGFLILSREGRLFLGAGDIAAIIDLQGRSVLAVDDPVLFWDWILAERTVILTGECVCIAYSRTGERRWQAAVEPPWDIKVRDGTAVMEVCGRRSEFPVDVGPTKVG